MIQQVQAAQSIKKKKKPQKIIRGKYTNGSGIKSSATQWNEQEYSEWT